MADVCAVYVCMHASVCVCVCAVHILVVRPVHTGAARQYMGVCVKACMLVCKA